MKRALSFVCFRYTGFNRRHLQKQIRTTGIDRIHIGCGNVILDGWLNLTYETREVYGCLTKMNGALYLNYDVLKTLPCDDASMQFVAGSHFIEHFDLF